MAIARILMSVLLLALACVAQHWQGTLSFPTTPNGPVTAEITINNADTADSGVGTVDKFQGVAVNIAFTWTRDDAGNIIISIEGAVAAGLANVPKGQPAGTSGDAQLNDGTPPSNGSYERN